MKQAYPIQVRLLKIPSFWVIAIGISLAAIGLNVAWRAEDFNLLGLSVLFLLAVSSQLWENRDQLNFDSGFFASFFGATLLTLLLVKSLYLTGSYFPSLFPLFSAFGLALIASGFKGLNQYWQELLLLLLLAAPNLLASWLNDFHPSLLTAKVASYFLWYSGFDVTRQGTSIYLPTGAVEVHAGCSGLQTIFYMLSIALLSLYIFPTKKYQKFLVPLVAILLGFLVNSMRVSLMAIMIAFGNQQAFIYWHEGEGSFVFSAIGSFLFVMFWVFLINRNEEAANK